MTTVGQRPSEVDDGHVAVLGHRLLNAAAVLAAAHETLRDGNGSLSAGQHALLEEEIERNLMSITRIARTLIHGGAAAEAPAGFCAQCYGREIVRIDGRTVPCTCVSWPRSQPRR